MSTTSDTSAADRLADAAEAVADADLLETVKKAAVALKKADIPFALCGGWAVYARGGPRSEHDADFVLRERTAVSPFAEAFVFLADKLGITD